MDSPHLLDRTRLVALEALKDAEFGSVRKVSEKVVELRHARKAKWDRIHEMRALQPRSTDEANHKAAALGKLQREVDALSSEIAQAEGHRDALAERAHAAGNVFENCTRFLGDLA